MATTTATALIGQAHPFGGGIHPTHFLFLTENDRPALTLYTINGGGSLARLAVWVPTVENMMEDLMLMAAALTGAQPEVATALNAACGGKPGRLELYSIGDATRTKLYALNRDLPAPGKVVLTILEDSSLVAQAARIRDYQADCELCISARAKAGVIATEVCSD
jgi:hypothetical protein